MEQHAQNRPSKVPKNALCATTHAQILRFKNRDFEPVDPQKCPDFIGPKNLARRDTPF